MKRIFTVYLTNDGFVHINDCDECRIKDGHAIFSNSDGNRYLFASGMWRYVEVDYVGVVVDNEHN